MIVLINVLPVELSVNFIKIILRHLNNIKNNII
jgi:hypothetical protein